MSFIFFLKKLLIMVAGINYSQATVQSQSILFEDWVPCFNVVSLFIQNDAMISYPRDLAELLLKIGSKLQ